ncbi:MAG TPA: NAD(P)/FAD-dependent oxidoreductase [Polyangiaceae bacterium]|nr:NAD(P)/FAD-dependent oxidoreductase [Polyangiaceae bacterium]
MTPPPSPVEHVQALVVGAGPVGLFATLCAARRGLRALLLDQGFRDYAPGHATLLHGSTLQLLREIGLAKELEAKGRSISRIAICVDGASVTNLSLPSPALAVPQSVLEGVLLVALRAEGADLRPAHQAATIEQHDDYAEVRVIRQERATRDDPHQSEWQPVESSLIRADYVIGADGYESRVRSALSIEAVDVGPSESFAMFEAEAPGDTWSDTEEIGIFDELGSVVLPLAGGRRRWAFQINKQLDQPPDIGRLRALITERLQRQDYGVDRIDWGTVIQFERRMARRFGRRRAWLAGDAAHVTSPLGGQSMNVGLSEARDLVNRITDSIRDRNGVHLERYAAEREREWHKLFGLNVQFDLLPHAPRWLAAHARRIVPALPASGTQLTDLLSQLGLRLS